MTRAVPATAASDYTTVHRLTGLKPDTEYFYRGIAGGGPADGAELFGTTGRFKTPAAQPRGFRFAVSGDMQAEFQPFGLFDRIGEMKPDFFVLLGDTMYSDAPYLGYFVPSLSLYRGKHRENRGDGPLQNFLKNTPVYAIWDDHEVGNNFDRSFGREIQLGRQAFREYWPVDTKDETVLYRKFSWSPLADFFILDTRQFRSPGKEDNSFRPGHTMLGARQKKWFKDALSASRAPFKFVFSSVPFFHDISDDKWSGFVRERLEIYDHIVNRKIGGIVFISADIHQAADNSDGWGYREYIVGPIATETHCRENWQQMGRFFLCDKFNYLLIDVTTENDGPIATVRIIDDENEIRFQDEFSPDDLPPF